MRGCDVSQPTCVYHDSGDTQSVPLLSGAPNEVITVLQTGVTLTFDPCPSPCCNVNNSYRHLPGAVPANALPHWWVASRAVTPVASVCENQGGLMSFNETDVEHR